MGEWSKRLAVVVVLGIAGPAVAPGAPVAYTYDAARRLVEAEYPDGVVVSYTYDASGNLLSREVIADGLVFADGFEDGTTDAWDATVGGAAPAPAEEPGDDPSPSG